MITFFCQLYLSLERWKKKENTEHKSNIACMPSCLCHKVCAIPSKREFNDKLSFSTRRVQVFVSSFIVYLSTYLYCKHWGKKKTEKKPSNTNEWCQFRIQLRPGSHTDDRESEREREVCTNQNNRAVVN